MFVTLSHMEVCKRESFLLFIHIINMNSYFGVPCSRMFTEKVWRRDLHVLHWPPSDRISQHTVTAVTLTIVLLRCYRGHLSRVLKK